MVTTINIKWKLILFTRNKLNNFLSGIQRNSTGYVLHRKHKNLNKEIAILLSVYEIWREARRKLLSFFFSISQPMNRTFCYCIINVMRNITFFQILTTRNNFLINKIENGWCITSLLVKKLQTNFWLSLQSYKVLTMVRKTKF